MAYLSKHDQIKSKTPHRTKSKKKPKSRVKTPIPEGEHKCYCCGKTKYLSIHHCYPGVNRNNSSIYKAVVWLCYNHHQGQQGVHSGNYKLDLELKQHFQKKLMKEGMTLEEFIKIFGRNYLIEEREVI